MRIEAADYVDGNTPLPGVKRVVFLADDGKIMLEVSMLKDGTGIEIRGVDSHLIDGAVHTSALVILPVVSNCIHIHTARYDP